MKAMDIPEGRLAADFAAVRQSGPLVHNITNYVAMNYSANVLYALGARPLMWHDMLLESGDARWKGFNANGTATTASIVSDLAKGIVICDWFYGDSMDSYPTMDYFKGLGYTVLACPWHDAKGTRAQGKYASEHGIDGMLGTVWHHYFGNNLSSLFVETANAAWNPGEAPTGGGYFYTHLRQMGWDMKVSNPNQTGTYYFDVPPQPALNN